MTLTKLPPIVWHYTDASGFIGITASNEVWATAPIALNDYSEFQYGRDLIERVYREIEAGTPTGFDEEGKSTEGESLKRIYNGGFLSDSSHLVYVLSATTLEDDLGQWRGYGREGYAIGLDTQVPLLRNGDQVTPTCRADDWLPDRGWYTVVYDPDEQIKLARETLETAISLPAGGHLVRVVATQKLIMSAAARMKHSAFASEHEIRYLYPLYQSEAASYRSGQFGVTSYVKLTTADDRVPIRSVTCGPVGYEAVRVAEYDASIRSAKMDVAKRLLLSNHYFDVDVSQSLAPFRW